MGILKRNTKKTTEKKVEEAPTKSEKTVVAPVDTKAPTRKRVLLGAHVSEKAAGTESTGVYTFRVSPGATKGDVKQAIKGHYGVTPVAVRIMNMEGKRVRFGRSTGRRKDWKKAIVTLPEGSHIDIHSGI